MMAAGVGRKIVAIGRNFSEHAKELGNQPPTAPFFFLKPWSSVIEQGQSIEVPPVCDELHHEVELGLVIGQRGRDIAEKDAMNHVGGYILGLDMTARALQNEAKKAGLPWTAAKGYDTFNPASAVIDKSKILDPQNVRLWLKVNGTTRQDGNTSDMIFKIPTLIAAVSKVMTLEAGDIIMTGTPPGVGPVKPGDVITAGLVVNGNELTQIRFPVIKRPAPKL